MLEHELDLDSDQQQQQILEAIARIREALAEVTRESERHIAALADQVDADRQTIASIESAARRRGLGIRLTRAELVERYAELNQEIIQPLTVSTGVIDMLGSGNAGPLTPRSTICCASPPKALSASTNSLPTCAALRACPPA
jgi:DNA-binding XRE family transcriptional regulator